MNCNASVYQQLYTSVFEDITGWSGKAVQFCYDSVFDDCYEQRW